MKGPQYSFFLFCHHNNKNEFPRPVFETVLKAVLFCLCRLCYWTGRTRSPNSTSSFKPSTSFSPTGHTWQEILKRIQVLNLTTFLWCSGSQPLLRGPGTSTVTFFSTGKVFHWKLPFYNKIAEFKDWRISVILKYAKTTFWKPNSSWVPENHTSFRHLLWFLDLD